MQTIILSRVLYLLCQSKMLLRRFEINVASLGIWPPLITTLPEQSRKKESSSPRSTASQGGHQSLSAKFRHKDGFKSFRPSAPLSPKIYLSIVLVLLALGQFIQLSYESYEMTDADGSTLLGPDRDQGRHPLHLLPPYPDWFQGKTARRY